jgi:hypothetical protein
MSHSIHKPRPDRAPDLEALGESPPEQKRKLTDDVDTCRDRDDDTHTSGAELARAMLNFIDDLRRG